MPSAAIYRPTTPSAAMREAALLALLPNLTRRISSALAMSPSASVSAFLHSIIGASVLPRSSLTMPAVISAIFCSPELLKTGGAPGPALATLFCSFLHFDELVVAACIDDFLDDLAAAFEDGIGHAACIQLDGAGRVIVAGNDVIDTIRRMVGIDDADDRDTEFAGFGDGNLVVADVDDENRIRQSWPYP